MKHFSLLHILFVAILCQECALYYNDDNLSYRGELYIKNASHQQIDIHLYDDHYAYLAPDQKIHLSSTKELDYFSSKNEIKIDDFFYYYKPILEIYSVPDNILLRKWIYDDKDSEGKQFFNLQDYEFTISKNRLYSTYFDLAINNRTSNTVYTVNYEFHITDEDLEN